MLNLHKYGTDHPITFELNHYVKLDNLYVGMITHEDGFAEPWSTLTVNLQTKCAPDCSFVDIYNNGRDIIDWLVENNLGEPTGRVEASGWCVYPEVKFNVSELKKHIM